VSELPDPSAEPAVRLQDLTVRFGDTTAVEGVSLEVAAGEMFGLLGPNGAGKTTTLRVLTTLLPAGSGTATVYGIAVGTQPMEVRRVIGFVPQQLSADAALHAIPTSVPYLDFLAPGILAQSALFVSIFYGIQIIWERDAGVLARLMATPTPRSALVAGKAFAAGMRALVQGLVVLVLAALLGVAFTVNPLRLAGVVVVVLLAAAFFSTLSIVLAGIVLSRERLMGIGQAITMPLFFASNALYPVALMPRWVQAIAVVNPLSYEVNALRGLLLGTPAALGTDIGVLAFSAAAGITTAARLLPRLTR
jgi:ABC-2 type transport system permease protein